MNNSQFKELFICHKANFIIHAKGTFYQSYSVFSAGANRFSYNALLHVREKDGRGASHLAAASSRNRAADKRIISNPSPATSADKYNSRVHGAKS